MTIIENKKEQWEKSYSRKENHLFYPNEEYVRFFAKYIAKRNLDGTVAYNNVTPPSRAIDFGCGAGRHILFLEEMGLHVDGFDISQNALNTASKMLGKFGADNFSLNLISETPKLDLHEKYDLVVACSVLDSMPFSLAQNYIRQLTKVLVDGGLIFLDLICNEQDKFRETEVTIPHEKGTIQTYYDETAIKSLLGSELRVIECRLVKSTCELTQNSTSRRYIVGNKK